MKELNVSDTLLHHVVVGDHLNGAYINPCGDVLTANLIK